MRKATLLFPLLLFSFVVSAQSWQWGQCAVTNSVIEAYAAAADNAGNSYGAGMNYGGFTSFGTIAVPNVPSAGIQTVWVKYSPTGSVLWADGTQNGDSYLYNITTDADNNFIVFGSFDSPTLTFDGTTLTNAYGSAGYAQFFIAKFNAGGSLLWAINDGSVYNYSFSFLCGTEILATGGITTDAAGNIYATSAFSGVSMTVGSYTLTNADPTGMTFDVYVAKYSPSGALIWAKSFGGTSDDCALGITATLSGDVYVAGAFCSPSVTIGSSVIGNPYGSVGFLGGIPKAYIARFSSASVPLWAQDAGGANGAYAVGVVHDPSGDVYMTGSFGDTSISFGTVNINRTYPATVPNCAQYIVKYDPGNTTVWGKTIGSATNYVMGYAIGEADCGEVWVSGCYLADVDIDGHTLPLPLPFGADPVFIVGYTFSGSVAGYSGLGSGGDDQDGIAVDPFGDVFIGGDYLGTINVGPDLFPVLSGLNESLYVGKYTTSVGTPSIIVTDTTLCGTASILYAPGGYANYYWDNAAITPALTIMDTGTYWVTCSSGCNTASLIDTFHVSAIDSTAHGAIDSIICNTAAWIYANPGYVSYTWNTGDTASSILVNETGIYWVNETNVCGVRTDTFRITFAPPLQPTALSTVEYCRAQVNFSAFPAGPGYTYDWSGPNGFVSTLRDPYIYSLTPADSGTYTLEVTDNTDGCSGQTSIFVAIDTGSSHLTNITSTQTIYYGSNVQLNADNAVYYWWMPDDGTLNNQNINNPIATPIANTVYTVYGMDSVGCLDSAHIIVNVIFDSIMIPSAFTPNGDGLNDIFRPIGMKYQKLIEFSIYNRWGQQIFTTADKNRGWDGTFGGVAQEIGTYNYLLIIALDDGNTRQFKGNVTLIR